MLSGRIIAVPVLASVVLAIESTYVINLVRIYSYR